MKPSIFLSAAAVTLFSSLSMANGLQELASPVEIQTSEVVVVNGQTFNKVIEPSATSNFADTVKLFAGDVVTKGSFSLASKATGIIFVTLVDGQNAKQVAADLQLQLVFANGNSAVFKADEGVDLLNLNDNLFNDSRIKAVKIELANNKYNPE
ncbi:hypothetical protein TUM4438_14510 [Shewanella sairae]|uniref:ASP external chaperone domain-containing protein n=1 Tax=Shewanella sairae TaxID=190310 RepID=A0ABQ4P979_9GAMM|nr:hypothetical protein [Shewanella sairae]MCL1128982.1 hypothetical protein [Shewanella sairae]GIU44092.1 hypothetical protein TUM4438_14510 [Shewanella sairae]